MEVLKLKYSDYSRCNLESCGSFFTSLKHNSKEHCHDFFEFCLITKGEICHIINGKSQELHMGDLLFIRPNDVHHFESIQGNYFQYMNLALFSNTVSELFKYLGDGFNSSRFLESSEPLRAEIPKSELDFVIRDIEYFIIPPKIDISIINSDLRTALVRLLTKYFPNEHWKRKTSVPVWLDWLRSEMLNQSNFVGGILTMQKLACKTPEHLCREFKKHYSMTPTEFINNVRLNYARSLLVCSDKKIIEIAAESGFENLSHFCHLYKKKYLVSPKEYRKLYANVIGS